MADSKFDEYKIMFKNYFYFGYEVGVIDSLNRDIKDPKILFDQLWEDLKKGKDCRYHGYDQLWEDLNNDKKKETD